MGVAVWNLLCSQLSTPSQSLVLGGPLLDRSLFLLGLPQQGWSGFVIQLLDTEPAFQALSLVPYIHLRFFRV